MTEPVALAVAAHPDDIEFMMAGTLLMLGRAGYKLHMMNLASGCCGSMEENRQTIAARRLNEAKEAARLLGARLHDPITDDLEVFYTRELIAKVAAVVRMVRPTIILLPSPEDYMEDHMIACRLTVSAAFVRGMPNFLTAPPRNPVSQDVTLYHALPYGLRDGMRRVVVPGQYVNITPVLKDKREALAAHRSQKEWLDQTQGLDSYLDTMETMSAEVGRWSTLFPYAEGWRRHSHLGFCAENADPLSDALGDHVITSVSYERSLAAGIAVKPKQLKKRKEPGTAAPVASARGGRQAD
jgi:LmbE family N-acetylglucosaminyl deacetylase